MLRTKGGVGHHLLATPEIIVFARTRVVTVRFQARCGSQMKQEDRFARRVRRVCDYLIASGSPQASRLEAALTAYQMNTSDAQVQSDLRSAISEVYPTIEKRTLAAVLAGTFQPGNAEDPRKGRNLFAPTNIIAMLGLILIAASLHWTYWSTRASAVIVSLDSVLETQRNLNIEEIVHTRDLCQYQEVQLDDQDVYRFVVAAREMAYYDTIWVASRNEAQNLKSGFWPLQHQFRTVRTTVNGIFEAKDSGTNNRNLNNQILGPGITAESGNPCDIFEKPENRTLEKEFRWYQASFRDLAAAIPLVSGVELFRGTGTASIEVLKKDLLESQSVVHRWLLPTLHGALGAVIYCLVRAIREPFLLPLGPRDIMLRLFFGAFVGYLISALFLPTGIMGQPTSGAAPITSLAAFIFGYSIDSFIGLLDRVNTYVSELPAQNNTSKNS